MYKDIHIYMYICIYISMYAYIHGDAVGEGSLCRGAQHVARARSVLHQIYICICVYIYSHVYVHVYLYIYI